MDGETRLPFGEPVEATGPARSEVRRWIDPARTLPGIGMTREAARRQSEGAGPDWSWRVSGDGEFEVRLAGHAH